MMLVYPGIFYAWKSHGLEEAADDHIHFWYDSMNDCYQNKMPIEKICAYIEAISDEDYEQIARDSQTPGFTYKRGTRKGSVLHTYTKAYTEADTTPAFFVCAKNIFIL